MVLLAFAWGAIYSLLALWTSCDVTVFVFQHIVVTVFVFQWWLCVSVVTVFVFRHTVVTAFVFKHTVETVFVFQHTVVSVFCVPAKSGFYRCFSILNDTVVTVFVSAYSGDHDCVSAHSVCCDTLWWPGSCVRIMWLTVFVFQLKVDAVIHFVGLKAVRECGWLSLCSSTKWMQWYILPAVWLIVFVFWRSISCFVFQHKMDAVCWPSLRITLCWPSLRIT